MNDRTDLTEEPRGADGVRFNAGEKEGEGAKA